MRPILYSALIFLLSLTALAKEDVDPSFEACNLAYLKLVDGYVEPKFPLLSKVKNWFGTKAEVARELSAIDAKLKSEDPLSRPYYLLISRKMALLKKEFEKVQGISDYLGYLQRQREIYLESARTIGERVAEPDEPIFRQPQIAIRYFSGIAEGQETTKLKWANDLALKANLNPDGTIPTGDINGFLAGEFLYYYQKTYPLKKLNAAGIKLAEAYFKTATGMESNPLELQGPERADFRQASNFERARKEYDFALSVLSDTVLQRDSSGRLVFPADSGENPACRRIRFLAKSFEGTKSPLKQIFPLVKDIRALQSENYWADKWWKIIGTEKDEHDVRGGLTSRLINGEGFILMPGNGEHDVYQDPDVFSKNSVSRRYTPDNGIGWRLVAKIAIGQSSNPTFKDSPIERYIYWNDKDTAQGSQLGKGELRIAEQAIPIRYLLTNPEIEAIYKHLENSPAKTLAQENHLLDQLAAAVRPYGELERGKSVIRPDGTLVPGNLRVVASIEGIRQDRVNVVTPFRWRWEPSTGKWVQDDYITVKDANPEKGTAAVREHVLTQCIGCHAGANAVTSFNGRCLASTNSQAFFTPAARAILQAMNP